MLCFFGFSDDGNHPVLDGNEEHVNNEEEESVQQWLHSQNIAAFGQPPCLYNRIIDQHVDVKNRKGDVLYYNTYETKYCIKCKSD